MRRPLCWRRRLPSGVPPVAWAPSTGWLQMLAPLPLLAMLSGLSGVVTPSSRLRACLETLAGGVRRLSAGMRSWEYGAGLPPGVGLAGAAAAVGELSGATGGQTLVAET